MVTKMRRRPLLIGLWWVLAGTAVVIVGAKMERAGEKALPGEPTRSQLETIYDAAQTAITGTPLGNRSYFHRGGAVGLDGHLAFQSRASAFKRLTDAFVAEQWVMRDSKQKGGEVVYAKLCRGGIATVLDGRGAASDGSLYMGVIWATDPKYVAWCEK